MKAYRTQKQFHEICTSMYNGNWSQAAEEAVEYGFYAADLIRAIQDEDGCQICEMTDFIHLAEMAAELRYKE